MTTNSAWDQAPWGAFVAAAFVAGLALAALVGWLSWRAAGLWLVGGVLVVALAAGIVAAYEGRREM